MILRRNRLWIKCFTGSLRLEVNRRARQSVDPDHKRRVASWHVNIYLQKADSDPSDPEYTVLEAYCGMTVDGKITGSGLLDPKDILIDGINYCQLSNAAPTCEICESGEMIPAEERFMNAKYCPVTPPLSSVGKIISKGKKHWNKWTDRLEQRLVLMKYRGTMKP